MTSQTRINLVSSIIFLYIMIHLWLWIVPQFQVGDRLDFFSAITKPVNPMSSETKDYPTILDSLLFTAENNWNMDEEQIIENMEKIAFHESKGYIDAIQQLCLIIFVNKTFSYTLLLKYRIFVFFLLGPIFNNQIFDNINIEISSGRSIVLKVGKRKFLKII